MYVRVEVEVFITVVVLWAFDCFMNYSLIGQIMKKNYLFEIFTLHNALIKIAFRASVIFLLYF